MLTAEQKIRFTLTGSPSGEPHFVQEGVKVVRRLDGGPMAAARVVFEHRGSEIVVKCPECGLEFGRFDASYGEGTYQQLGAIRALATRHHDAEEM